MTVQNSGILYSIYCIAQRNCCSSAPVHEQGMFRIPSRRLELKWIPSGPMRSMHQRTFVAFKVQFPGCSQKLYAAQKARKRQIASKWSVRVSDKSRISSYHQIVWRRRSSGMHAAELDCKKITALTVPCKTLVGVYIPSRVRKAWQACDAWWSGSCWLLCERSRRAKWFAPAVLVSSCFNTGMGNWYLTVKLLTGRRSTVNLNSLGKSLETNSRAQAQEEDRL